MKKEICGMHSPFDSDQADLKQAIEWIAKTLYPNDRPTIAKKRVREGIRKAADKDRITIRYKGDRGFLETRDFLSWAIKRWPDLKAVAPVSYEISPPAGQINLTSHEPDVFVSNAPNDYNDLIKACREAQMKSHLLTKKYEKLRTESDALKAEDEERREKDKEMREMRAEYGRQGKGVPRRK